jgi:2-polyprenyl-6-hydroxyphenyl methylase/3-demethylubiquinone-9 3-methyltransferase
MSAGGSSSVNKAEIAQFDALAARWWDPSGPMRPLHAMNPVRAVAGCRVRRRVAV